MSTSSISSNGKSEVAITIDLLLNPALKAIRGTSLKRESTTPLIPRSAANGGTAPGSTPNAFTSY